MSLGDKASPYDSAFNRIGPTSEGSMIRDNTNKSMFSYTQIPEKFYHPKPTRNALGLVGGNEVSNISGSVVDLESDLFGISRSLTKCAAREYIPACPLGGAGCPAYPGTRTFVDRATGATISIDTSPKTLPTSQYATYPGVSNPATLTTKVAQSKRF